MAVNPSSLTNLTPWKPGQSGHPGGKPVNARNRITGKFLNDLAEHYEKNGVDALNRVCAKDPVAYINAIVRLCPTQLEATDQFEGMSNDALRLLMAAAQQYVEKRRMKFAAESVQPVEFVPMPQSEASPSNE